MGIRDRRAALRVPAVFAVKGLLRGRVQLGQAEDLGAGGMTLRRLPDMPAPAGATMTLTFDLPDGAGGGLMKVTGIVVSDALAGTFRRTGVRFHGLSDEATRRIERFCQAFEDGAPTFARGAAFSG
jgi:hypothetical protein